MLTMRRLASLLNPCQVNNDVTLSAAHNLANNALKTGITYNTTVRAAAEAAERAEMRRGSLGLAAPVAWRRSGVEEHGFRPGSQAAEPS